MPPPTRFWVVLIGKTPTSFHAKEREDLLPTLRQLQRTQKDVSLRWFERGKVWESPEAAMGAAKLAETEAREKRTKEWRPGGEHRDPKARFEMTRDQKRAKFKRDQRGGGGDEGPPSPFGPRVPREDRPQSDRPTSDRPASDRPRPDRPRPAFGDRRPTGDRPFGDRPPRRDRPSGPPMENPFKDRPRVERPERPRADRPPSDRPPSSRPPSDRSPFSRPSSDRPPHGRPRTGRPPSGRPPVGRGGGFKPPKRRS